MATESSPQVPDHVVTPTQSNTNSLPAETVNFAHRMFDAAREGNTELLFQAVDAGLPVNLTNDKGNTLLMLAAYAGHAELTKGLLQRKADPNRLNDLGQSIIAGAVFKSHDAVVRILAKAGADPRIGKPTAIEAAHIFGRKELMEVLGAQQGDIGTDVPTPPSARPEK
ncbi:ankyrin repeat-containing domain protein [Suillus subaureus]|uniref:Ankyrin repeat-containing domain protein n=1 Tax=Suillus subaureus TaxID=48587 RepID=A0A9P7ELU0_9AGAM|nr:ankyrin repeat-containing domain protein [Suillus subaureus]KAG1824867.1 ankyrin repeat-containing domain protein [Suillus subaureus]